MKRHLKPSLLLSSIIACSMGFNAQAEQSITPEWLKISGESRLRFEHLDEQFRVGTDGSDQGLFLRTLLKADADLGKVNLVGELIDARELFNIADEGSPLSTSTINPLDVLQLYAKIDLFADADKDIKSYVRVGRFTMDIGTRRFVSRNGTRNTINSYNGIDWHYSNSKLAFRAFYTNPTQRRIDGDPLDNDPKTDQALEEVDFWGVYLSPKNTKINNEWYLFDLKEDDDINQATNNRDLTTVGTHWWTNAKTSEWYYDAEFTYQWGDTRSSSSSTTDLDQQAYFAHLETGYSFDAKYSPKISFVYDYASGDEDPNDLDSERFDTLFGSRRFDYGPTAVFGPFIRSNISTPGVKLNLKPTSQTKVLVGLRGFWLAEETDAFSGARIPASADNSDTYIGTQLEARWQWTSISKKIKVDLTGAYLNAGDVLENNDKNDSTFVYAAVTYVF
ncbi:alginate export family protein [Sessilibacter sp. MAH4]